MAALLPSRPLLAAALLALLVGRTAAADDVETYLEGLSAAPDVQAVVAKPLRAARDAGLPTRYLLLKAKEGVAKRVPATLLGQVLAQLEGHLGRAKGLVPEGVPADADVVEAVAQALQCEVAAEDLSALMAHARGDGRAPVVDPRRAVSILIDVHELGMGSRESADVVRAAIRHHAASLGDGAAIVWMLRQVRKRTGLHWAVLVTDVVDSMGRGPSFQAVGDAILDRHGKRSLGTTPGLGPSGKPHAGPAGLSGQSKEHGKPAGTPGLGPDKVPPGQDKNGKGKGGGGGR